jgi:hypothetical protein
MAHAAPASRLTSERYFALIDEGFFDPLLPED